MESKFEIGDKVKDSDGDVGIITKIQEQENDSNLIEIKYLDRNATGICKESDLVIDEEEYYLCYVKDGKCWFTDNWKEQWGDDWNDEPYECNAGEPYDDYSVLIKDSEEPFKKVYEHKPINHKICIVDFPDRWVYEPKTDGAYSVEQINKSIETRNKIPWLKGEGIEIYPKTTYRDFLSKVKAANGVVYEPIKL